jgi:hypothetical protein
MNQMVTQSLQQQLVWRQIIKLLNDKQKKKWKRVCGKDIKPILESNVRKNVF